MFNPLDRLDALRAQMDAAQIDLIAVGPTTNMRYLLGFAPHADERLCLLLISPRDARIVVPVLNADQVAAHTDLPINRWADQDGPGDALAAALSAIQNATPGWVSHGCRLAIDGPTRADFLLPLLDLAAPATVTSAGDIFAALRTLKSADEIDILQRAAAQADLALAAGADACRPGVSEAEVAWAIESAFRQDGAEMVDFTLVASGPHGAFPHHHAGERRLQPGDAVVIDIGATLDGYKSDVTRMVHIGTPDAQFLQAYAAVLEANQQGFAAARPGVSASEVDAAARQVLEAAGYGPHFTHRTGHGLGMDGHEPPWITPGNQELLAKGMVFSIEPGVYFPGKYGIRIEDIVVLTEDGARRLTGAGHDLIVRE